MPPTRCATGNMSRRSPPSAPRSKRRSARRWKGAAKPDVVLVEFFDYACPYCKASNPHIERLLKEDKGLRVVYRELPILGPRKRRRRAAVAGGIEGRPASANSMTRFGPPDGPARRPSPWPPARGRASRPITARRPDAEAELKRNFKLAGQLGATGTPLFVVGNRVMNSAVGYDALKKAIADARARG